MWNVEKMENGLSKEHGTCHYTMNDDIDEIPARVQPLKQSSKGVMSLITGPSKNISPAKNYDLDYYDRIDRKNNDEENSFHDAGRTLSDAKRFNPDNAEFTLAFFCDFETCRNSQRIVPILATFLTKINSIEDDRQLYSKNVDLICIPNADLRGKSFKILSKVTDFWCLGFNHSNRLHLIR